MRRAIRVFLLGAVVSTAMAANVAAGRGGVASVPLNNGQETTDAKFGGSGSFEWWVDGVDICYILSVRNLTTTPFAAHIHGIGGRRVAAPIVVPLIPPNGATGTTEACTAPDSAVLAAIVANPRDYYVNVHTPLFPGGEVRGQLK